MNSWIDLVNANNDIHKHLNETFLDEHIMMDNTSYLNWMNIFNSKIPLSNEFIIKYINYIDWKYLTRILDEPMLNRYYRNVLNWNIQLYGPSRTIEFVTKFQKKINWRLISMNPPSWFDETHYFIFNIHPVRLPVRPPIQVQINTICIQITSAAKTPVGLVFLAHE